MSILTKLCEYEAKFEKKPYLFRSKIGIFDIYFLKDCAKKVCKIYKSIVIENFKPVPLCPIFVELHKIPLLISNIVKGAV